jgi:hypothetical protein
MTAPPAATVPVPVAAGANQGNAVKVILIVVGVIVFAGILGLSAVSFIGWRIAHRIHAHQEGNNVKVETPFGTMESTKDPEEAARNLGLELYPGAEIVKNSAATANFGGVHTVSASFETGDPFDKVATFYKSKFPNAMVTTSQSNHCTIVSNDRENLITINIEGDGDKTKIQIATVKHGSDSHSSDE